MPSASSLFSRNSRKGRESLGDFIKRASRGFLGFPDGEEADLLDSHALVDAENHDHGWKMREQHLHKGGKHKRKASRRRRSRPRVGDHDREHSPRLRSESRQRRSASHRKRSRRHHHREEPRSRRERGSSRSRSRSSAEDLRATSRKRRGHSKPREKTSSHVHDEEQYLAVDSSISKRRRRAEKKQGRQQRSTKTQAPQSIESFLQVDPEYLNCAAAGKDFYQRSEDQSNSNSGESGESEESARGDLHVEGSVDRTSTSSASRTSSRTSTSATTATPRVSFADEVEAELRRRGSSVTTAKVDAQRRTTVEGPAEDVDRRSGACGELGEKDESQEQEGPPLLRRGSMCSSGKTALTSRSSGARRASRKRNSSTFVRDSAADGVVENEQEPFATPDLVDAGDGGDGMNRETSEEDVLPPFPARPPPSRSPSVAMLLEESRPKPEPPSVDDIVVGACSAPSSVDRSSPQVVKPAVVVRRPTMAEVVRGSSSATDGDRGKADASRRGCGDECTAVARQSTESRQSTAAPISSAGSEVFSSGITCSGGATPNTSAAFGPDVQSKLRSRAPVFHLCSGCSSRLAADDETGIVVSGLHFHAECFACSECDEPLLHLDAHGEDRGRDSPPFFVNGGLTRCRKCAVALARDSGAAALQHFQLVRAVELQTGGRAGGCGNDEETGAFVNFRIAPAADACAVVSEVLVLAARLAEVDARETVQTAAVEAEVEKQTAALAQPAGVSRADDSRNSTSKNVNGLSRPSAGIQGRPGPAGGHCGNKLVGAGATAVAVPAVAAVPEVAEPADTIATRGASTTLAADGQRVRTAVTQEEKVEGKLEDARSRPSAQPPPAVPVERGSPPTSPDQDEIRAEVDDDECGGSEPPPLSCEGQETPRGPGAAASTDSQTLRSVGGVAQRHASTSTSSPPRTSKPEETTLTPQRADSVPTSTNAAAPQPQSPAPLHLPRHERIATRTPAAPLEENKRSPPRPRPPPPSAQSPRADRFADFRRRALGVDDYFSHIGFDEKLLALQDAVVARACDVFDERFRSLTGRRAALERKKTRVVEKVGRIFAKEKAELVAKVAALKNPKEDPALADRLVLEFVEDKENVVDAIRADGGFLRTPESGGGCAVGIHPGAVVPGRASGADGAACAAGSRARGGAAGGFFKGQGKEPHHFYNHTGCSSGLAPICEESSTGGGGRESEGGRDERSLGGAFSIAANALKAENYAQYRRSLAAAELPRGTRRVHRGLPRGEPARAGGGSSIDALYRDCLEVNAERARETIQTHFRPDASVPFPGRARRCGAPTEGIGRARAGGLDEEDPVRWPREQEREPECGIPNSFASFGGSGAAAPASDSAGGAWTSEELEKKVAAKNRQQKGRRAEEEPTLPPGRGQGSFASPASTIFAQRTLAGALGEDRPHHSSKPSTPPQVIPMSPNATAEDEILNHPGKNQQKVPSPPPSPGEGELGETGVVPDLDAGAEAKRGFFCQQHQNRAIGFDPPLEESCYQDRDFIPLRPPPRAGRSPSKLFSIDFWGTKDLNSAASPAESHLAQEEGKKVLKTAFQPLQQDAAYRDLTEFAVLPVKFDSVHDGDGGPLEGESGGCKDRRLPTIEAVTPLFKEEEDCRPAILRDENWDLIGAGRAGRKKEKANGGAPDPLAKKREQEMEFLVKHKDNNFQSMASDLIRRLRHSEEQEKARLTEQRRISFEAGGLGHDE